MCLQALPHELGRGVQVPATLCTAETTSAGSWALAWLVGDRNRYKATRRMKTRVKPIFP